jgi:hypothetical protein
MWDWRASVREKVKTCGGYYLNSRPAKRSARRR